MSIRLPVSLFSTTQTGVANTRVTATLPQDVTNITVKVYTAATFLDAGTVDVYIQTSDDGGTTWYDCYHYAQLTSSAITKANALWGTIAVDGSGGVAGNANGYIGAAASATLGASKSSGLPILGQLVGINLVYATAATNGGLIVNIYGSQSLHQ